MDTQTVVDQIKELDQSQPLKVDEVDSGILNQPSSNVITGSSVIQGDCSILNQPSSSVTGSSAIEGDCSISNQPSSNVTGSSAIQGDCSTLNQPSSNVITGSSAIQGDTTDGTFSSWNVSSEIQSIENESENDTDKGYPEEQKEVLMTGINDESQEPLDGTADDSSNSKTDESERSILVEKEDSEKQHLENIFVQEVVQEHHQMEVDDQKSIDNISQLHSGESEETKDSNEKKNTENKDNSKTEEEQVTEVAPNRDDEMICASRDDEIIRNDSLDVHENSDLQEKVENTLTCEIMSTQQIADSTKISEKNEGSCSSTEQEIVESSDIMEGSSNSSDGLDSKQISDETVSSTNNHQEEPVTNQNLRQTENIFDKMQITVQSGTTMDTFTNDANITPNTNTNVIKNKDTDIDGERGKCPIAGTSQSEKETSDDDILNFSIEIQENSDDDCDDQTKNVTQTVNQTKSSTEQDPQAIMEDSGKINTKSEFVDTKTDIPSKSSCGNYIQKISSVIRAIDSSKTSVALKKDRDNIFSVLRAEISTKDVEKISNEEQNAIVIENSTNTDNETISKEPLSTDVDILEYNSKKGAKTQTCNSEDKTVTLVQENDQKTNMEKDVSNSRKSRILDDDIISNVTDMTEPVKVSDGLIDNSKERRTPSPVFGHTSNTTVESRTDSPSISNQVSSNTGENRNSPPVIKTISNTEASRIVSSIVSQTSSNPRESRTASPSVTQVSINRENFNVSPAMSQTISDAKESGNASPTFNKSISKNRESNKEGGNASPTFSKNINKSRESKTVSPTVGQTPIDTQSQHDNMDYSTRPDVERSFMQALLPPADPSSGITSTNLSNIIIKTEKHTEGYGGDESGDILDILQTNASAGVTVTENRSTINSGGGNNNNIVTVAGTFQPVVIKQEPVDTYNTATTTITYTNTNPTIPASNSLEHLSRQVHNIGSGKSGNCAKKSTTKQNTVTRSKPSMNTIRAPLPATNLPNTCINRFPAMQRPPNMFPRTNIMPPQPPTRFNKNIPRQPISTLNISSDTRIVYPLTPLHSQHSQAAVSVSGSLPSTGQHLKVMTVVSNGKTMIVPATSVVSISKPAAPQNVKTTQNSKYLFPQTPLPKSTINIDTVGLNAITELIARKNPIPNYKPPPIPDYLKALIEEDKCKHICYECGDTFLFESSLKVHRSRTSMSLSYRCEECKTTKVFFNKCQFLGHLRGHLNIEKTQAVPIHIKSDSISITTLDHGSHMNFLFKWLDNISTIPESLPTKSKENTDEDVVFCDDTSPPKKAKLSSIVVDNDSEDKGMTPYQGKTSDGLHRCHECGGNFKDLKKHFGYDCDDITQFLCSICRKMLPKVCSARAHKRIHEEKEPYVCPECGKSFSTIYTDNKMSTQKESFAYHMYYTCFHTCRMTKITCPKCDDAVFTTYQDYQWHLSEKLEQYYKCQVCPMAFKLPQSFEKHFANHGSYGYISRTFKVIYRCHLCDSVMDDKSVLDAHILKHVSESRKKTHAAFCCRFCKKWFENRDEIKQHVTEVHEKDFDNPTNMMNCYICGKAFKDLFEVLKHELLFHSNLTSGQGSKAPNRVKLDLFKCRVCGIIVFSSNGDRQHYCINPNPAEKPQGFNSNSPKKAPIVIEKVERKILPKPKDFIEGSEAGQSKEAMRCVLCGREETSQQTLQGHLLYHQTKGDLVCYLCQRTDFQSLMEVHTHQRNCPMKALISANMKRKAPPVKRKKKLTSTSLPIIEYPCDVCGYVCLSTTDLANHHKENHSEPGIHPCHLCSLTYETQDMLKKHIMVTHEGKRLQMQCQICLKRGIKKSFSSKERLEKHLSTRHRKSKSRFNVISGNEDIQMTAESMTDTVQETPKRKSDEPDESVPVKKLRVDGDAQFTCAKCLFSSNNRLNFVNHLSEHKMENFVQCLECGLSFAVMPSLRKHLFMVHKIRDFENYCKENNLSELPEAKMDDSEIRKGLLDISENEDVEEEEVPSNPLECRVCHKVFDNDATIRAHLRTHGMAFIKNRRSKAPSLSRDSVKSDETSDSSSK